MLPYSRAEDLWLAASMQNGADIVARTASSSPISTQMVPPGHHSDRDIVRIARRRRATGDDIDDAMARYLHGGRQGINHDYVEGGNAIVADEPENLRKWRAVAA